MPRDAPSLLAGRNSAQLSDQEQNRIANTMLGLEGGVNFRVSNGERTRFRTGVDQEGNEFAEIVFGPDVYPGTGVVDPNSSLSMKAAIAHELSHYFRWYNKAEYEEARLENLDEAMTSLEAVLRYYGHLTDNERQGLIRDAIQRIQIFVSDLGQQGD